MGTKHLKKGKPTFELEGRLRSRLNLTNEAVIVGVDEVGTGALAGPVVAGAVALPPGRRSLYRFLHDSKELSPSQREQLVPDIAEQALTYAVGMMNVELIEKYGIKETRLGAMRQAVERACEKVRVEGVIVDGRDLEMQLSFIVPSVDAHARKLPALYENKADGLSLSVAAASILAKVTRDFFMLWLHQQLPQYGFDENKGYGTPSHLAALEKYGPSIAHRTNFAPVRAALERRSS
jgi:ribonuclease HII